jgi:signal transduction histidine kinase/AmiR/NasT family two-component response regulator/HPt (histidine-containing phosphotransfer) domain-containing protein
MTPLVAPAVALMNRLRYPQKFVLISLLFALPLGLLMTFWLGEIEDRIAFARKERAGVEYVAALRRVLEPLEVVQALARRDAADAAAAMRLGRERARLAAAAAEMDRVDARLGGRLRSDQLWQALRVRVVHPSVDPAALIGETLQVMVHAGDASNLILDPDLDSYYLMDAVVQRLPALSRHLAAFGAGALAAGAPGADRPAALAASRALALAERAAIDRGHAVAFRENPALRPALEPRLTASWAAVAASVGPGDAAPVLPGPGPGSDDALDRHTRSLSTIFAHHDAAAVALDGLLEARMREQAGRRALVLVLLALPMALVAYLWVGFYVAVRRAVGALADVSRRMSTGEVTGPVALESRDEMRQVVESFNSVAGSLVEARDAAETAARAKANVLAVISHEIRTPLNGILGMTHLLLGTTLADEQRRYAETIRDSGDALGTIVNDVLDASKMEAGRLELALGDFDLERVVGSVAALMGPRARDKRVALETTLAADVPRAVRGDGGRLRQVLLNLVGNAIKFTDVGAVRLEITRLGGAAERSTLRFAVIDTGPGIPAEAQPRLFQRFSQVDPAVTQRFGGTGLGLAISKHIVVAMGGEIGVESTVGRGSTFWFVVALDTARGAVGAEAAAAPAVAAPLRILVAEDNRVNQEVAVGLLRRQGHAVDVVGDGRAAVDAVRAGVYDVVLMDVHMPELDGLAATREIRRLLAPGAAPVIIALSASALPDEMRACLAAGMDAYLAKPIDPAALRQLLASRARPAAAHPAATAETATLDEPYFAALVDAVGPARFAAIVAGVTDDVRPHQERLAQGRAHGDLSEVRAAAHALQGIAMDLGLTALASLTAAIEQASAAGDGAGVEARCGELDACLAQALARLHAFRAP